MKILSTLVRRSMVALALFGQLCRSAESLTNPTSATNLVAWCVVPFDAQKRGPEERAAMLKGLGLTQLAYDWRAEHIPTFDAEIAALQRHGVHLRAWWFPNVLNTEAQAILTCIRKHQLRPELWVMSGEPTGTDQNAKVQAAADSLKPVVQAAADLGCKVGLYNHGGWFGQPENQLAIRAQLAKLGYSNVGLVYNFHHGHEHLERLPNLFPQMVPHLLAVNLNGMTHDGERRGRKIIPFGSGEYDPAILNLIRTSQYRGPIGILGHTDEDAEMKLKKDLKGLRDVEARVASGASTAWPGKTAASIAKTLAQSAAVGTPKVSGQEPSSQKEEDWVDDRWSRMDVGLALASNLHLPGVPTIAKALTLRLPGEGDHCAAFDLSNGALRAIWSGGFLQFDKSRFGLMGGQKPAVSPWFICKSKEGFPGAKYRFLGMRHHPPYVVLEHEVDGARIDEILTVRGQGKNAGLFRHFSLSPSSRPLSITAADLGAGVEAGETVGVPWTKVRGPSGPTVAASVTSGTLVSKEGEAILTAPPSNTRRNLMLGIFAGERTEFPSESVEILLEKARLNRIPPMSLMTRGVRGADSDIFAVDTLTMPYENPAQALLFGSGVDLMPDGTAYVCTMHGDVWQVSGIDDTLRELRWTRFATGLFQPLGLKIRNSQVYVLGRDRITRLIDGDLDGRADRYENFHDGIATSTGGHDFVTCLEQDSAGRFYYVDPSGMHRVSADGRESALVAAGFRNPNGMGVSPDGRVLTAAPQQGTWTPSSGIWETDPEHPDLWGGYPSPKVTPNRPLGFDAPLCWIPHSIDNSSGSQVWVPEGQWGPLGGQMLHLLWGRSGMMAILRDAKEGRRNAVSMPLPVKFLSGPNRGSFFRGALYVAGSTGWQTSAVKDGCLQRVRWTGKRYLRPVAWEARRNGVNLTFSEPVRVDTAQDTGSYSLKRWNYRYSKEYGSKDWSVTNPSKEGRDEISVRKAELSSDHKTVQLQLDPWGPAMQFEIKYNLDAVDGKPIKGTLWGTVNP